VNILINNAGIQYNYDFVNPEIATELIETELQTNLIAPLQLIKLMLPHLITKPKAAIVNVSSGLGLVPKQTAPVYCASKAGLHIATKALRWQLETTPIKVFEIIAPLVDTPMTQGRGKGKISPEALVDEFWNDFTRDRYEIKIGKTKLLFFSSTLVSPSCGKDSPTWTLALFHHFRQRKVGNPGNRGRYGEAVTRCKLDCWCCRSRFIYRRTDIMSG
jgi:short-subunit dehydrogenase involved in D-alanine esterification of teichoic acids